MMEKNKKGRAVIIFAAAVLILGTVLFLFLRFYPGIKTGNEISGLLQPVLDAENQSMDIDIQADISGERIELDTDVYLLNQEDAGYLVVEQNGYPLYVVDGVLYLENGKAYKLADDSGSGGVAVNFSNKNLFLQIAAACEMVEITRTEKDNQVEYGASITGEQAKELLLAVAPSAEMDLSAIETLSVRLVAEEEQLERIEIAGNANVGGDVVGIDVEISDFQVLEAGDYVIPETIKNAVATVDKDSLFSLTTDLYRLLSAFGEFTSRKEVKGTVELRANCGIIQFKNKYDLSQLQSGSSDLENAREVEGIPAAVALLCMEGDISCTQQGESHVYKLELKEDAMQKLAETIVPEIVNQVVSLTNGTVVVTVENNTVASMDIQIDGAVQVLFSKVDAEMGAEFDFLVE